MVKISSKKTIYSKQIESVEDTSFSSFVPQQLPSTDVSNILTVEQFFENYDVLFYDIPKTGSNSHSTLIKSSSEYLGLDLSEVMDTIKRLQRENADLKEQINQIAASTAQNQQ